MSCLTIAECECMSSVQKINCTRDTSLKCEWHEPSVRVASSYSKIDCYKHKVKFVHCLNISMPNSPKSIGIQIMTECG